MSITNDLIINFIPVQISPGKIDYLTKNMINTILCIFIHYNFQSNERAYCGMNCFSGQNLGVHQTLQGCFLSGAQVFNRWALL